MLLPNQQLARALDTHSALSSPGPGPGVGCRHELTRRWNGLAAKYSATEYLHSCKKYLFTECLRARDTGSKNLRLPSPSRSLHAREEDGQ